MINEFQKENRWLSNFWKFESPLLYGSLCFWYVETFFVAMKTDNQDLRAKISMMSPGDAKRESKVLEEKGLVRGDWLKVNEQVMRYVLEHKFSVKNPRLRSKLLATGTQYLQEGNWWGDEFWGFSFKTNAGLNLLGHCLMEVRDNIREEEGQLPVRTYLSDLIKKVGLARLKEEQMDMDIEAIWTCLLKPL